MSDSIKFDDFVSKNWGYEKIIVNGSLYCGKILRFIKDRSCSLHYHRKKTETFHLISGKLKILYFSDYEKAENIKNGCEEVTKHYPLGARESMILDMCEQKILYPGDTFHLPPGLVHKMTALQDSDLLEISTQDFVDDSYRLIKGD